MVVLKYLAQHSLEQVLNYFCFDQSEGVLLVAFPKQRISDALYYGLEVKTSADGKVDKKAKHRMCKIFEFRK